MKKPLSDKNFLTRLNALRQCVVDEGLEIDLAYLTVELELMYRHLANRKDWKGCRLRKDKGLAAAYLKTLEEIHAQLGLTMGIPFLSLAGNDAAQLNPLTK